MRATGLLCRVAGGSRTRWELHWELLEELGAGAHVDEACWCRVEQTAAVKTGNAGGRKDYDGV
jgi:hypothetical protein